MVGAAPTGDAPTTSEWSTNLLPTKVRFILDVWRYLSIPVELLFLFEFQPTRAVYVRVITAWLNEYSTFV